MMEQLQKAKFGTLLMHVNLRKSLLLDMTWGGSLSWVAT